MVVLESGTRRKRICSEQDCIAHSYVGLHLPYQNDTVPENFLLTYLGLAEMPLFYDFVPPRPLGFGRGNRFI